LTFKTLVNAQVRCSKCERYGYYDYQCPSESQHVKIVPTKDVDDSKVVEDIQVPPKTVSIIKDIAVGFAHRLLMKVTYLLIVSVMK